MKTWNNLQQLADAIDIRRRRAPAVKNVAKPNVAWDVRLLAIHPAHLWDLERWSKSFTDKHRRDWPLIRDAVSRLAPEDLDRARASLLLRGPRLP